jgi:Zn-dependent protease with chaperone function
MSQQLGKHSSSDTSHDMSVSLLSRSLALLSSRASLRQNSSHRYLHSLFHFQHRKVHVLPSRVANFQITAGRGHLTSTALMQPRLLVPYSNRAFSFFRDRSSTQLQYFDRPDGRDPRLRGLAKGVLIAISVVAGTCVILVLFFSERAPYTGRWRVVVPMGKFADTLEQQTRLAIQTQFQGRIYPSHSDATQLVKRVAERLIRANNLAGRDWQFVVIHDKSANAFVTPGGTVCVFSGLLQMLETENQLAAVLAHELGHAVAKHAHESISMKIISTEIMMFLAILGFPLQTTAIAQMIAPDFLRFDLHHSRKLETEADMVGLNLMAKACVPLESAPRVFELLASHMTRMGIPEHSRERTHPTNPERIIALRQAIPEVRQKQMQHCPESVSSRRFL